MKFVSLLKTIGKAALGVASVHPIVSGTSKAAPVILAVVEAAARSIATSEAEIGPGKGGEKKQRSLGLLDIALPPIASLIETILQVDIDNDAFCESVSELVDALVKLMNSLKILPKQ